MNYNFQFLLLNKVFIKLILKKGDINIFVFLPITLVDSGNSSELNDTKDIVLGGYGN